MGKTTLALNIARNIVIQQIPTAIFSLDNSRGQIIDRIINIESAISNSFLTTAINLLLHESKFYIYDNILNITDIEQTSRKLKLQENIGLIVIDNLQLVKSEQTLEEVIIRLKTLAQELNIPIIVLSHLSKELESRKDKRPMLSDFKDSTCIKKYADKILFVYRDDYYYKDIEEPYFVEVIIAKNNKRESMEIVSLIDFKTRYVE